jgi:hypothetical protein
VSLFPIAFFISVIAYVDNCNTIVKCYHLTNHNFCSAMSTGAPSDYHGSDEEDTTVKQDNSNVDEHLLDDEEEEMEVEGGSLPPPPLPTSPPPQPNNTAVPTGSLAAPQQLLQPADKPPLASASQPQLSKANLPPPLPPAGGQSAPPGATGGKERPRQDSTSSSSHAVIFYRHSSLKRQNISCSFNLSNFTCNTCTSTEHPVLHRENERFNARDLVPQAFVVADQNFPGVLPVDGNGECVKIFRMEHGSIPELVESFLEFTKGYVVPAGTVVVLSSASHLAEVGMAAYAADFVGARLGLLSVFQGGLEVVHGFPIPLGGINDRACIRALPDFTDWLASVSDNTGRDLLASRNLFRKTVLAAGSPEASADAGSPEASASSGSPAASEPLRYTLPTDLSGKKSGIFFTLPRKMAWEAWRESRPQRRPLWPVWQMGTRTPWTEWSPRTPRTPRTLKLPAVHKIT